MKVVAYDPFLTPERAIEMGVEKVELDELLARADFITLHTPLTDQTRNILSRENLAKTKKGVRIINCARGGLIDEAALKEALDQRPCRRRRARRVRRGAGQGHRRCSARPTSSRTPHLGASTNEAQVNVAIQVAEQMADYPGLRRRHQRAQHAVACRPRKRRKLKPYMALAEKLGSLVGQLAHGALTAHLDRGRRRRRRAQPEADHRRGARRASCASIRTR